ncbi:MAG: sugar transferase [Candidatus Omnitrophica bacterium]|nr:sugar transferase [Candidatus Omnitrophota bacterium]
MKIISKVVKRIFDITFSLIVLFLMSPIFILAAIVVKFDSKGTVIFRQTRVGKNERLFDILKFRTMQNIPGTIITAVGDKRVTRAGKILRRTNFDELPQFINILKGEMSVIGPRPELPEIVALYTQEQKEILKFKPGFSSPATLKFLSEEKILENRNLMDFYLKKVLPQKIACDLRYFKKKTNILSDIMVILKTIGGTFNE